LEKREDDSFLRKLKLCSSEIHQFVEKTEDNNEVTKKHKEKSVSFNNDFLSHCNKVYSKMSINPFNSLQFQKLNAFRFPQIIVEGCHKVFKIDKHQHEEFVHNRVVTGSSSVVTSPLKRNELKLPVHLTQVESVNSRQEKLSFDVITKLRAACDVRQETAKQLFDQEFTGVDECLADK